jgi:hypothetical protein
MTPIAKENLKNYKGKILGKKYGGYIWLFKLIDVKNDSIIVSQGIDIEPKPRFYHSRGLKDFNSMWEEGVEPTCFLPTKVQLNLYIKYTREAKFLNSNKSNFGTK